MSTNAAKNRIIPPGWCDQRDAAFGLLASPARALLNTSGSLTAVLRTRCAQRFSFTLLTQQRVEFDDYQRGDLKASNGLLREVLLGCADTPWVFGQTLIPAETLSAHPWLNQLGDQPLGDCLFSRDDVVRSEFSFAQLGPTSALHRRLSELVNPSAGSLIWARRSYIEIACAPLLINELFLPALLSA